MSDFSLPDLDVSSGDAPAYVDTPSGILTRGGSHYRTRETDLRDYAGEVFDHVTLQTLLRWADAWQDAARTVFVWTLPMWIGVCLWTGLPVWVGAVAGVVSFAVWYVASPAFPIPKLAAAFRYLAHPLAQAVAYVPVLSYWAAADAYGAAAVGLVGFVAARWGLLGAAASPLLEPIRTRAYPLPVADQILRGLIHRVALAHRVSVGHVDAVTSDVLQQWGPNDDS